MPSNSTSLVGATPVAPATTRRRGDLVVGDLFRNPDGGKVYMHTGARTRPPSGSGDVVTVNGVTVHDGRSKSLGRNLAGRDIIAYQAIVVRGHVTPGEDGAVVTFDGAKEVVYLGRAAISLPAGV